MKVLLVVDVAFNPQVGRWINRLRELGVTVACVHLGQDVSMVPRRSDLTGLQTYCLLRNLSRNPLCCLPQIVKRYWSIICSEKPDVIWAICISPLLLPLLPLRWGKHTPLVVTICGSDFNVGVQKWHYRLIYQYVLSRCDLVATTTKEMMEHVLSVVEVPANRQLVLFWGIDTGKFYPPSREEREITRRRWGIAQDEIVINMGRIYRPIAYYREAVEALSRIAALRDMPRFRAVFVKREPYEHIVNEVKAAMRGRGIVDRAIFVDRELDDNELRQLYTISDITLNLLSMDQLGATLLEAMAVGTVLVTTDLPQYRRLAAEGFELHFLPSGRVVEGLVSVVPRIARDCAAGPRDGVKRNRELAATRYSFAEGSLRFLDALTRLTYPSSAGTSIKPAGTERP